MSRKGKKVVPDIDYACLVYNSSADGCWIAHSLKTDQIGTGECVINALADMIKAVNQVHELAKKGSDIAFYQPPPKSILSKMKKARELPIQFIEIAYRIATNQWPNDAGQLIVNMPKNTPFKPTHHITNVVLEDAVLV